MAHKEKEGPKNPGLTVTYYEKGDFFTRYLGPWLSIPDNALLGQPGAGFQTTSRETMAEVEKMYEDLKLKGEIEVVVNKSPFFHQMKRLFSKERRANFFLRATVGVANTLYGTVAGKLWKSSYYNPHSEMGVIQHPSKAIAAKVFGLIEFFDKAKHEGLKGFLYQLPFFRMQREFQGTINAMKRFANAEEREKYRRILTAAFGRYVGADIGRVVGFLLKRADPVFDVLPTLNFFKLPLIGLPIGFPFDLPFNTAIGALLGHIQVSTSKKNIFFNESHLHAAQPAVAA